MELSTEDIERIIDALCYHMHATLEYTETDRIIVRMEAELYERNKER